MVSTNRAVTIAVLAVTGGLLTACQPGETMTPHEARDQLVTTIEDTGALLDVPGWKRDFSPRIQECDGGNGVKYGYSYSSPPPDGDHLADANTVADYWDSLGMTVRIDTSSDPVVFATGGPVTGLSFGTGPGLYYIAGSSLCVPGNANDLIDEEYNGQARKPSAEPPDPRHRPR